MTPYDVAVPDRAARRAVTAVFAVNGLALASWVARIPSIQAERGVAESTLGLLIMGMAVGVVVVLPIAGGLAVRLGSRPITLAGAAVVVLMLPAIAVAPSIAVLAVALALFGAGVSTMDIGMNTQGVGIERTYGRSIMIGFHAAWSVGTLIGALLTSVLMALGVGVVVHLVAVSGVVAIVTGSTIGLLRAADRAPDATSAPRFSLPRGPLLPIALVAFAAAIGEGVAGDWSGVFLRDVVVAPEARVSWGYVALTAAMTLVRFAGDRVVQRFGSPWVIRAGGAAAAAGFVVVVLVPVLPVALAGFAMIGVGVGALVPLSFSAAARSARAPGEGVAATATLAYSAFLVGPPLVGVLAEGFDLRVPFAGLAMLILVITLHGSRRSEPPASTGPLTRPEID